MPGLALILGTVCKYRRWILITGIIFALVRFSSKTLKLYFKNAIRLSREIRMFLAAPEAYVSGTRFIARLIPPLIVLDSNV